MRKSWSGQGWIEADGVFYGIGLGSDACAEHEMGISGILRACNVDRESDDVVQRQVAGKVPSKNIFLGHSEKFDVDVLVVSQRVSTKDFSDLDKKLENAEWPFMDFGGNYRLLHHCSQNEREEAVKTAWDQNGFCVISRPGAGLLDIRNWFLAGDAYIGLNLIPGLPFGISILCYSRIPAEYIEKKRLGVEQCIRAKEIFQESGIEDRLKEAGKTWCALSPYWRSDSFEKHETKYPVMVWLNTDYIGEKVRNERYGWYTIEELEEWVHGRGRVIKGEKN